MNSGFLGSALLALALCLPEAHVWAAGPAPSWTSSAEALANEAGEFRRRARSGDGTALAQLYRVWNLAQLLDQQHTLESLLAELERMPGLDSLTKDHVRLLLLELRHASGNAAETDRLTAAAGVVTSGWVMGPFDNAAGGGHDFAYPPELGLDLKAVERGKNHPVGWRPMAGLAPTGVFALSELLRPEAEASSYLLFTLSASRPTQIALRVGSADRLKVFFDGAEVLAVDTQRIAAWDQETIPLRLEAGAHTVLLKASYTEARGELRARITAPNGGAASGVTIGADVATLERAVARPGSGRRGAHAVRGVQDALERALAGAKGPRLSELLSLRSDLTAILALYDERKTPTPPELDLERAIEVGPARPLDRFFLAHRAESRDPSRAREQLDAALALAADHVPSKWKLAKAHARVHRTAAAREMLEEVVKADPSFTPAITALLELDDQNRIRGRLSLARLRKFTEHAATPSLHSELATRLLDHGFRVEATKAAEAALRLDPGHPTALRVLFSAAVAAGDLELARAQLGREISQRPWRLAPRLERARIRLAETSSVGLVLAEVEALQALFPDASELQDFEAELHLRAGDSQLAVAALERSLVLDPQRTDIRRHRDALAGVSSQIEDSYSIEPAPLLERPVSAAEKNAGAATLFERTAVRLYDNGQASRFRQSITRLTGTKLRDALRQEQIYYSPSREIVEILSAERIRPNGVTEKATRISDSGPSGKVSGMYVDMQWKQIVFQDVEPGDLIHIRYRIDSLGANIFGGFFGDIAPLSANYPKYDVSYVAESPIQRPLYTAQLNAPPPQVEVRGLVQHTEWNIPEIPALEPEPHGPPMTELATMLSVSTYESWEDLAEWYARLFREQLELDPTARAAAHTVVQGATDDLTKVKRLYDYVVKNTRYVGIELGIHGWKPFKASEVHRRRYGDCKDKATLLAALLREVGIEATITLIRTIDRGTFLPGHASMWAFNHAITYVPSVDLFLDGTAEHSGSTELPWQDQGGTALVVFPDGRSQLRSPPESSPEANLNQSSYRARIIEDGTLVLEGTERFLGARASSLRSEMQEVERRRERVEEQLNQMLPGSRVTKLDFSDLDDLEAPVHYQYAVEAPKYAKLEGQVLILPATLFQHRVADSYALLAERKTDLVIEHAWSTNNRVEYELPRGWKIEELPTGVTIDSEYLRLDQEITRTERGFVTDDTVTFKKKRVPAAAYPEFRRAALEIDRALGRRAVLSR